MDRPTNAELLTGKAAIDGNAQAAADIALDQYVGGRQLWAKKQADGSYVVLIGTRDGKVMEVVLDDKRNIMMADERQDTSRREGDDAQNLPKGQGDDVQELSEGQGDDAEVEETELDESGEKKTKTRRKK